MQHREVRRRVRDSTRSGRPREHRLRGNRRTGGHWRAGITASVVATVAGIALADPAFLVLAAIPLAVLAYASSAPAAPADPASSLAVERAIDEDRPKPGESVAVRLTVENVGDRPIADVQIADAPPVEADVSGPTQVASALRSGERVTLQYEATLPRGEFEFGPVAVRTRDLAGLNERVERIDPEGSSEVVCETLLDSVPLRRRTIHYVGTTPTDEGGEGVEFYATREYRRGDPIRRIDWRRYAKTGSLSTVELREQRATTVVIVVDDRRSVQRAAPDGGPDTLDLAAYAASRATTTLLEDGHRVGITTVSQLADGEAVQTGAGAAIEDRAERLEGVAHVAVDRSATSNVPQRLIEGLPAGGQVLFVTPLTDDWPTRLASKLQVAGHPLSVLSADLVSEHETIGATLEAAHRQLRASQLRRQDVPVVDWQIDAPLAVALAELLEWRGSIG